MATVIDLTVDDSDDDGLEVVSRSDEGQEQFTNIVEEHSDEGQQQFESIASEIPSKIKRIKTEERFR